MNTAARVESATRETGDDLLVSAATLELLTDDRDGWEERPAIPLKGKSERVRLFAPRGSTSGAVDVERPVAPARN